MLSSTALGIPRFSITRDRRSSSTRRRSLPKFARARKAETTIVPFLPGVGVAINSPFQSSELYSLKGVAVNDYWPGYVITFGTYTRSNAILGLRFFLNCNIIITTSQTSINEICRNQKCLPRNDRDARQRPSN